MTKAESPCPSEQTLKQKFMVIYTPLLFILPPIRFIVAIMYYLVGVF